MKHYQNWLDLQHYSMHLKRLINIKARISRQSASLHTQAKKLKIRSKTLCSNQKYPHKLIQPKDGSLTQPNSNIYHQIIRSPVNKNSEIMSNSPHEKKASDYLNNEKENYQNPASSIKQQHVRHAQQSQSMSLKKNSIVNHQIKSIYQSSKAHCYSQNNLRFQTNKNQWEFEKIRKKSQQQKKNIYPSLNYTSSNRFSEFKKYVSAKAIKKNHCFLIQIKIKQIDHIVSSQNISFWFELKTFDSNIKSGFYNFKDFVSKTIYMSCLYQPKVAINICLKYFRNLQKLAYGQYLLILKDNISDFQEDISIQNKGTQKTIRLNIKGKMTENKKKLKKKNKLLRQKQTQNRISC